MESTKYVRTIQNVRYKLSVKWYKYQAETTIQT